MAEKLPSRITLASVKDKLSRHLENASQNSSLDRETLNQLRYAGSVYAFACIAIFLVALYFAATGSMFTGLLVLAPSALLGVMAWQCLKQVL